MTTPADFAKALLTKLGLPVTDNNIQAMVTAEKWENGFMGNAAAFNPLNVTQHAPGSVLAPGTDPGIDVQAYPDWETGLDATVRLFKTKNSYIDYSDILASFAADAAPDTTLSVWSKNKNFGWAGKTLGTAAQAQWYANVPFPQRGSVLTAPVAGVPPRNAAAPSVVGKVGQVSLAAAVAYGVYRLWGIFR